jgi:hypothetical protein
MVVTVTQAAKLLGVSPRRVRFLLSQKRIQGAFKAGQFWLIPLSDGQPVVTEGKRGPKPRWVKVRKTRYRDLKVVKVLQRHIKDNSQQKTTKPVISISTGNEPAVHVHEIDIYGPSKLCYSLTPRDDKGGARVWLETYWDMDGFVKDFVTNERTLMPVGRGVRVPVDFF